MPGRSDNNVKNHWNSALRRMGASSTLKKDGGGAAFERRRKACEMLENYAKKYTREKQAEKERKEAEKRTAIERGEAPASKPAKKRRRSSSGAVAAPATRSGRMDPPPAAPSPGGSRKRRAGHLTVQVGDEAAAVASPPVSVPESTETEDAPDMLPMGSASEAEELSSTGSNSFWQTDSENPTADHFSPITPFLPATTSNESDVASGEATADGIAVSDGPPLIDAPPPPNMDAPVPPSPFAFLWSPAVPLGAVRPLPPSRAPHRITHPDRNTLTPVVACRRTRSPRCRSSRASLLASPTAVGPPSRRQST